LPGWHLEFFAFYQYLKNILEIFAIIECSLFCISSRLEEFAIFGELYMMQIPDAMWVRFEACLEVARPNLNKISISA
jgi:hypothetical protein